MVLFFFFGEIPKRSTGADCKSVGDAFVGSNPALPTASTSVAYVVRVFLYDFGAHT